MNNNRTRAQNAEVLSRSTRSRFSTRKAPSRQQQKKRPAEDRVAKAISERAEQKAATAEKRKQQPKSQTSRAMAMQRAMLKGVEVATLEDVVMSEGHRVLVGKLLDEYFSSSSAQKEEADAPDESRAVVAHLTGRLSFDMSRAKAAVEACGEKPTLCDALDWLCLKLPANELKKSLKNSGRDKVVVIVGGSLELAADFTTEGHISSLEQLGFSREVAKAAVAQEKDGLEAALQRCMRASGYASLGEDVDFEQEFESLRLIYEDAVVDEASKIVVRRIGGGEWTLTAFKATKLLMLHRPLEPPSQLFSINQSLRAPTIYEALLWLDEELVRRAERERRSNALRREEEKARKEAAENKPVEPPRGDQTLFDDQAEKAARVAFLKSINVDGNLDRARKAADNARRFVLGDLDDDDHVQSDDDDEEEVAVKDEADEIFESALSELMRENNDEVPTEVWRSLLTQALAKKKVNSVPAAVEEARRLREKRKQKLEPPQIAATERPPLPFSPLLQDIRAMLLETEESQPWLVVAPKEERKEEPASDVEEEATEKEVAESERLRSDFCRKREKEAYAKFLSQRSRLPAFERRSEIVSTIGNRRVTVVSGATGSGKTTQVPQLVLDDMIERGCGARFNAVVTQPRRISAIGVAQRIADERTEKIGETAGYSIRGETKRSSKTRILLCTTGLLLRRLQCDADLKDVSHCFVDEVHERDLSTDFLLIVLKRLLDRSRTIKLVLMSATLNAEHFSNYFKAFDPALLEIPGRAHPVTPYFLEDALELAGPPDKKIFNAGRKRSNEKPSAFVGLTKREWAKRLPGHSDHVHAALSANDPADIDYDLIARLVVAIRAGKVPGYDENAAILIFLPGIAEIASMIDKIGNDDSLQVHALHSALSSAEQSAVFANPPKGKRKVVVATNIAETSITIDDVCFVIDSARQKELRYDADRGLQSLEEVYVSRAAARQRRGRAGRVRPGVAFHLVTRSQHDTEFADFPIPEMLRTSLEDIVLQILLLDLGDPHKFLAKALDPPPRAAVDRACALLASIDALEVEQDKRYLTALGYHLASLPLEPRVGKLLLVGAMLGAPGPAMTLAAVMTCGKSVFVSPLDARQAANAARRKLAVSSSDHLTAVRAYDEWRSTKKKARHSWAREHFVSTQALAAVDLARTQFADHLKDLGFIQDKRRALAESARLSASEAECADTVALLKAILCAGLYPNVMRAANLQRPSNDIPFERPVRRDRDDDSHEPCYLHPSCLDFDASVLDSRYLVFQAIVRTSKVYVRDATTVHPLPLVLFGGALTVHHEVGAISVDGQLHFRADPKTATLIKLLRSEMELAMLNKIKDPTRPPDQRHDSLVHAVKAVLGADTLRIATRNDAEIGEKNRAKATTSAPPPPNVPPSLLTDDKLASSTRPPPQLPPPMPTVEKNTSTSDRRRRRRNINAPPRLQHGDRRGFVVE